MHKEGSLLLSDYASEIAATDVLSPTDFNPVLQGLYGEVGGIMSTVKKHVREKSAYPGFRRAAEEEFGDTLWYLAAICRRMQAPLEDIFAEAANHGNFKNIGAASDIAEGAFAYIAMPVAAPASLDITLVRLGQAAAALLGSGPARNDVVTFARAYLDAIHAAELAFSDVARGNLRKARGAFLEPQAVDLIGLDFDSEFGIEEQLPREFKIRVNQRGSGKSYLQWNGVFIGDPLTDNIADRDGYRFHDVFHFAYAAILHWSPVIRALIKHKRKSQSKYDEEQDSGRAIVVEEGLTAWIFSRAKELNYFENQEKVSLGILKTIEEFVSGYEVEKCPLKLWEKAIMDGYSVFRQIKKNQGGWIIGNRKERTLQYMPLES
ncbi:TPA: nucleoside triphosphate pyrophosphohydrolase family protein [Pseudomonas aeruginosa]|jgi:NTP pyrophosphatase (non-canonical NTP hydrolase)|uniref:Nucleoside triphosphate pyrophosphohydrolase family protein n=5 Tax=Pseudomonadota TaxID=1224 RepID=A0A7X3F2F7_9PSED|nr:MULTISPECIES: nucleoside triphosphate pyrophosphohydrolase family protein [Pseudomonadota]EKV8809973.1 nucleoside triphosphate pyrophosphohydrolase family protein [Klebsiella aerogenes]EKX8995391.1 nucleoside triphosphate pyrophosphohydrolase family protein [Citrobacter freundii]MBO9332345.1 pyrophosphatase [Achromobacter xylosoxidans]MPT23521.1 pyrophosphatase [Starkeya sp.]OHC17392.1 MAG: pyrophosphatase [Pseudomonadales bacterium RIFCSPHIGHO2_01_FULL_64_12]HAT2715656.1 nucleoside tripho|tara:strand:- start:4413 stop:5543 length:1131 start_codon:yes stop_codon:yes gene_type:complete